MKTITIDYPGLSLNQVREKFSDCFYDQSWYSKEAFANEKIPAGKWEVSLKAIENSFSKTWEGQQHLLVKGSPNYSSDEVAPPAAVLVYAICKHFKDTGERVFTDHYVRTSSVDSDGGRVVVGYFDAGGLDVNGYWDGRRGSFVGLASARKLESSGVIEPSENLFLELSAAIEKVKQAGYKVIKEM